MLTLIRRIVFLLTALAVVTAGCGTKIAPSTSIMDSPEYHYTNGLKYLDNGKLDEALRSFDRAVALAPKSPLGYIGKGLVFGKKGDFKAAFDNMEKAKDLEEKGIESRIGMIRLLSMQRSDGWIAKAEKEFNAANAKEPGSARLNYYMGIAYKMAFDFDKAAVSFRTVLDLNKDFTSEANTEWALIQKIQRAAPGSVIGKKIALIDKIDRADIAALFDQEMNLEKLFTKRGTKTYDTTFKAPTEATATAMTTEKVIKMEAVTDIADHWLKPSIDTVIKLQVRGLEPGPNHTFEPDKLITKAEFALMLEDILIKVSGDEKLATKYIGAASAFPDVRSDHYSFNAVMTAASRGYLEADKATGEFNPGASVSGADALLTIREFKNQLKF
jgi:tetratricopeptide (TPR) repeat protein